MTWNLFTARNRMADAGIPPKQAEAIIDLLFELFEARDIAQGKSLVTKADLAEFKVGILNRLYLAITAQTIATVGLVVALLKMMH